MPSPGTTRRIAEAAVADLLALAMSTTGSVWYVDSANAAAQDAPGFGETKDKPFATINYAVSAAGAGANSHSVQPTAGDVILVGVGHTETVSAAGGITFDVAGLTVIGLGHGGNRPTITFATATTADIEIDADDIVLANVVFQNTIDNLAAPLDVDGDDFSLIGCDYFDDAGGGSEQTIRTVLCAGSRMTVHACRFFMDTTAGAASVVAMGGGTGASVTNCYIHGDFSVACIELDVALLCTIGATLLENTNAVDVCIAGAAAVSGHVYGNYCRIATDAQTTWINTPGLLSLFENYGVNSDGETGILIGTPSA
jgi:hypothetical protein